MINPPTAEKTIRHHLIEKSDGKWRWRYFWQSIIRTISCRAAGTLIGTAVVAALCIVFANTFSDHDSQRISPYFNILFGGTGTYLCLKLISNWIHNTLFSNHTRFQVALPSNTLKTVVLYEFKFTLLTLLIYGIGLLAIFSGWHHSNTAPTSGRQWTAAAITWLNLIGLSGLIAPLFSRKRPSIEIPANLWSAVVIGIILLNFIGWDKLRNFREFLDVYVGMIYPAVFEWLPPFWGILWWNREFEVMPESLILPASIVIAILGGFGFYRTIWQLREILQSSHNAILAPHFSHAESVTLKGSVISEEKTEPVSSIVKKTSLKSAESPLAAWRFIERLLKAWLTPEQNRARTLALGNQWPRLTFRWLKGWIWLGVGCLIVALSKTWAIDNIPSDSPDSFIGTLILISGVVTVGASMILGLRNLLGGLGSSRIFAPSIYDISGLLRPIAMPVRILDLLILELKCSVIFSAASIVPLNLAGASISHMFDLHPGRTLMLITIGQLLLLASIPSFHYTLQRYARPISFRTRWFWLWVVGGLSTAIITIGGAILAISSVYMERYFGFGVFVPLLVAAANYSNWYFISRFIYDIAAFDAEDRNS